MEHNENSGHLKSYFEKAGKEEPVVSINEVNQFISAVPAGIVSTTLTSKTVQQILAQYKYWLGGGLSLFTGAALLFTLQGKGSKDISAKNQMEVAQSNNVINQDNSTASIASNESEPATASAEKLSEMESSPSKELLVANKMASAKNAVKKPGSVKTSYYFPGAASVNFESDGDNVNMIIGDEVEQLEINGVLIDKNEYSNYTTVIENGINLKNESDNARADNKEEEKQKQQKNREIMNNLIKELKADHLMDESGHFEFQIKALKVFVGKKEQNESITRKYINLYETVSGNRLTINSNIRIQH